MNESRRTIPGAARSTTAPDRWVLKPEDLPAPATLTAEPVLAGVGENAVYRSILFRSRSQGVWARLHPALRGILLGMLIFVASLFSSSFLPLLILIVVISRQRSRKAADFFRIQESMLNDLLQAPLIARDWSVALWAWATRPGGRSSGSVALLTAMSLFLVAATMGGLLLGAFRRETASILAALGGLLAGSFPFQFAPAVSAPLPAMQRRLRLYRLRLLRSDHPLRVIGNLLFRTFSLLFLIVLASAAVIEIADLLVRYEFSGPFLDRIFGHPSAPYACFLAGVLVALGSILLRRSWVGSRRDLYLQQMDREMTQILEYLQYRDDARRSAPGRHGRAPAPALTRPAGAPSPASASGFPEAH